MTIYKMHFTMDNLLNKDNLLVALITNVYRNIRQKQVYYSIV